MSICEVGELPHGAITPVRVARGATTAAKPHRARAPTAGVLATLRVGSSQKPYRINF